MENFGKAYDFAKNKHSGDKRKFGNKDYFTHPYNVMEKVSLLWDQTDPYYYEMLSSALLHDVVEDTNTNISEIYDQFGKFIGDLVGELTNDPVGKKKYGNAEYNAHHVLEMSDRAFFIKLCDRWDNISDWETADEDFNKYYYKSTKKFVESIRTNRSLNINEDNIISHIEFELNQINETYNIENFSEK